MKRKISLLLIILLSIGYHSTVNAQWLYNGSKIYYNNGNVGIGTSNPLNQLDIYNSTKPVMRLFSDNPAGAGNPTLILSRGGEETLKLEGYPNVEGRISATVGNVGFMTFYTGNNTEKLRLDANGNLGIGIIPTYKVDIAGNLRVSSDIYTSNTLSMQDNSRFTVTNSTAPTLRSSTPTVSMPLYGIYSPLTTTNGVDGADLWLSGGSAIRMFSGGNATPAISILKTGLIGIGTYDPQNKLDIYNSVRPVLRVYSDNTNGQGNPTLILGRGSEETLKLEGYPNVEGRISSVVGGVGYLTFYTGSNQERLRISPSGNIGINTSNPQKLLDVNGTIHAREVLVDNNNWSDFVFEKDYKLPSVNEIENYISINGHLPNIPSTKEVKETGVNVSEMQAKLLQKIEELTLYIIDQNKRIELLEETYKGK